MIDICLLLNIGFQTSIWTAHFIGARTSPLPSFQCAAISRTWIKCVPHYFEYISEIGPRTPHHKPYQRQYKEGRLGKGRSKEIWWETAGLLSFSSLLIPDQIKRTFAGNICTWNYIQYIWAITIKLISYVSNFWKINILS